MNFNLYRDFIQELINEGIKVQNLLVTQICESIKLYKMINR